MTDTTAAADPAKRQLNMKLRADLNHRLQRLAVMTDLPRETHVENAIELYVDAYEELVAHANRLPG